MSESVCSRARGPADIAPLHSKTTVATHYNYTKRQSTIDIPVSAQPPARRAGPSTNRPAPGGSVVDSARATASFHVHVVDQVGQTVTVSVMCVRDRETRRRR